jgi:hypothetical protein
MKDYIIGKIFSGSGIAILLIVGVVKYYNKSLLLEKDNINHDNIKKSVRTIATQTNVSLGKNERFFIKETDLFGENKWYDIIVNEE